MNPRKRASIESSSVAPVTRSEPETKLFVLDSNVLMHDPSSLLRFQEHDVYIQMVILEELDNNKKGMSEVGGDPPPTRRFIEGIKSKDGRNEKEGVEKKAEGRVPWGWRRRIISMTNSW